MTINIMGMTTPSTSASSSSNCNNGTTSSSSSSSSQRQRQHKNNYNYNYNYNYNASDMFVDDDDRGDGNADFGKDKEDHDADADEVIHCPTKQPRLMGLRRRSARRGGYRGAAAETSTTAATTGERRSPSTDGMSKEQKRNVHFSTPATAAAAAAADGEGEEDEKDAGRFPPVQTRTYEYPSYKDFIAQENSDDSTYSSSIDKSDLWYTTDEYKTMGENNSNCYMHHRGSNITDDGVLHHHDHDDDDDDEQEREPSSSSSIQHQLQQLWEQCCKSSLGRQYGGRQQRQRQRHLQRRRSCHYDSICDTADTDTARPIRTARAIHMNRHQQQRNTTNNGSVEIPSDIDIQSYLQTLQRLVTVGDHRDGEQQEEDGFDDDNNNDDSDDNSIDTFSSSTSQQYNDRSSDDNNEIRGLENGIIPQIAHKRQQVIRGILNSQKTLQTTTNPAMKERILYKTANHLSRCHTMFAIIMGQIDQLEQQRQQEQEHNMNINMNNDHSDNNSHEGQEEDIVPEQ